MRLAGAIAGESDREFRAGRLALYDASQVVHDRHSLIVDRGDQVATLDAGTGGRAAGGQIDHAHAATVLAGVVGHQAEITLFGLRLGDAAGRANLIANDLLDPVENRLCRKSVVNSNPQTTAIAIDRRFILTPRVWLPFYGSATSRKPARTGPACQNSDSGRCAPAYRAIIRLAAVPVNQASARSVQTVSSCGFQMNPDPSPITDAHVEKARPGDRPEALALVFAHLDEDQRQRRVEEVLAQRSGLASSIDLWVASRGQRPIATALAQIEPGRSAHITLSRRFDDARAAAQLLRAIIADLTASGVQLAQSLLEVDHGEDADMLRAAGFRHISNLLYLVSLRSEFPTTSIEGGPAFVPLRADDTPRLANVVAHVCRFARLSGRECDARRGRRAGRLSAQWAV